jgi:type 1 glutamine amidotransferase
MTENLDKERKKLMNPKTLPGWSILPFLFLTTPLALPAQERSSTTLSSTSPRVKVLVLTGNEYPGHPWKETAPLLGKFLAEDPRLKTTVNQNPNFLASPRLADYQAIVLNYMNWQTPDPGPEARRNLQDFVQGGKGLVLVHYACGAFQGWPEFAQIAGRAYDPKLRGHDPHGKFTVEIVDVNHPITRGMKSFATVDELYTCLAGDRKIHVLAQAISKVDHKAYPMAFINRYGKGRVFHCVLGHDAQAFRTPEVQELYRRGTAWAAGLPPLAEGKSP